MLTTELKGTLTPTEPENVLKFRLRADPNFWLPAIDRMRYRSYRPPICNFGRRASASPLLCRSGISSYTNTPAPLLFAAGVKASSPVDAYCLRMPDAPIAPETVPSLVRPSRSSVCVLSLKLVLTAFVSSSTSSWAYHCAVPLARSELTRELENVKSLRPWTSCRPPSIRERSPSPDGRP